MFKGTFLFVLTFFSILCANENWTFSGDANNLNFRYKLDFSSKIKNQQLFGGLEIKKLDFQNRSRLVLEYIKKIDQSTNLSFKFLGKFFYFTDSFMDIFLPILNFKDTLRHMYSQIELKKGYYIGTKKICFATSLSLPTRHLSKSRISMSGELKF